MTWYFLACWSVSLSQGRGWLDDDLTWWCCGFVFWVKKLLANSNLSLICFTLTYLKCIISFSFSMFVCVCVGLNAILQCFPATKRFSNQFFDVWAFKATFDSHKEDISAFCRCSSHKRIQNNFWVKVHSLQCHVKYKERRSDVTSKEITGIQCEGLVTFVPVFAVS